MREVQHASKRIPHATSIPNLIEIQLDSYRWFLEEGLPELFSSFSPILDFTGNTSLTLHSFTLGQPKYTIEECRDRDMTFEAPIKARVSVRQGNREVVERDVYIGELPLMTDKGTFVINGAERVVVSQLARSPGVYFEEHLSLSGRMLYKARIIPSEGSWIEIETETQKEEVLTVQVGQQKKIPYLTFLRALNAFPNACEPMKLTVRAIRDHLWMYRADPDGGLREPIRSHLLPVVLAEPVVDRRTGEVVAPAGARLTYSRKEAEERNADLAPLTPQADTLAPPSPAWVSIEEIESRIKPDHVLQVCSPTATTEDIIELFSRRVVLRAPETMTEEEQEEFPRDELLTPDNLIGKRAARAVVDPKSGELLVSRLYRFDKTAASAVFRHGITEVVVYDVPSYVEATLDSENGQVRNAEEALVHIFHALRPNDPATLESARSLFQSSLFDPRRYDLGRVGRFKICKKLELPMRAGDRLPLTGRMITREDAVHILRYILNLDQGYGTTDDIDHLENKRVRSVGELLYSQLRIGFLRMEKVAKERMTSLGQDDSADPQAILSTKPISASIKSFFGSSQLSQFMDQTNPLAELTSKRRLSSLGPGGLSRQSAKLEVRDVHHSHYGRICPIETPEGPNIGLIGSLAVHARVDKMGFLQTPYRRVRKGLVTDEIVWMTADEDHKYHIAPGNERVDDQGRFVDARGNPKTEIQVRYEDQYPIVKPEQVQFMDVSPTQIVSVATAMIPFLENDDANRALMGSNMQRQAVPTVRPQRPIVKTGVEKVAALDSGAPVLARRAGTVRKVTSREIVVEALDGEKDTYRLLNMLRSNQSTCITQRPVVRTGQRVRAGQVLADGPCTDHGELALGQNVLVAFMPWGGYNYEDAILVSERLVRDDVFTSIHIEKYEKEARDTKLGPEEITRDIPNVGEDQLKDLDENGIIRIGADVGPEDILVGQVAPKGQGELTAEERLLIAIFGKKAEETRDVSLKMPHGEKGKVIDVKVFSRFKYQCSKCSRRYDFSKRPERLTCTAPSCDGELVKKTADELNPGVNELVRVYVAQKRRIMEGDKMAGRHGNKGVISKIVPEEDMPFLPDGTPVDIVLNPLGVPSRMNIGQILETHLGMAGACLDCSFVNPAFEGATESDIRGELEFTASYLRLQKLQEYISKELGLELVLPPDPDYHRLRDEFASLTPEERLGAIRERLREASEARLSLIEDHLRSLDPARLEVVSRKLGCPPVSEELADATEEELLSLAATAGETGVLSAARASYDYAQLVGRIRENAWNRAGLDPDTGKCHLRDGFTGATFDMPVTIGYIYMMKLAHLVDDKIHARSTGPYSLVTQQPLGGKAQFGGQRFGEMEVWALEAYGAAYTLQEILTIKSDDVQGRVKTYESIVRGDTMLEPGVPESFKILVNELQSLGLRVEVLDDEGNVIDLRDKDEDVNPNEDPVNAAARRRARQGFSGPDTIIDE